MSLLDWLRRGRSTRPIAISSAELARTCPHCGTALPEHARYCFMCGEKLFPDGEGGAASPSMMSGRAIAEVRERLVGQLDGRYAICDLLGAGGMGLVFRADDLSLERPVAIKVLPPDVARDGLVVARFQREAKTAARLDHPNIVPIYGVESGGGLHYFIMKFVAGRTLHQALRAGPAPFPIVVRVMRDAAAGLSHAHARGVVHRDVKPGNIILDEEGHAILTDFGISKVLPTKDSRKDVTQLTEVGNTVGTPHYMAPEQALGQKLDGRADQYSLAIIAFQLLTGVLPFDAESPHAIIHLHINEAPPRLTTLRPEVPPDMAAAIARAMSKSPANRFDDITEFASALTRGAGHLATTRTLEIPTVAPAEPRGSRGADAAPTIPQPPERTTAPADAPDASTSGMAGSPRALWTSLLVLLLVSGMAWAASRRGEDRDATASDTTAVQAGTPRPAESPSSGSEGKREVKPSPKQRALLGVSSTPHASLYVDGNWVGETPLTAVPLETGRTHHIRVVRKGYRVVRDSVRVVESGAIHRRYVLHRLGKR